jgi:hypothetical protein
MYFKKLFLTHIHFHILKLKLLVQKRDILSKLTAIHTSEIGEKSYGGTSHRVYTPSINSSRSSRTNSSNTSWATFASKNTSYNHHNNTTTNSNIKLLNQSNLSKNSTLVPKLKLNNQNI